MFPLDHLTTRRYAYLPHCKTEKIRSTYITFKINHEITEMLPCHLYDNALGFVLTLFKTDITLFILELIPVFLFTVSNNLK